MLASFAERKEQQQTDRFSPESHERWQTWPHFTHRTQKGTVQWMVVKAGWLSAVTRGPERELVNQVLAEGKANSLEEAWSDAIAAAGTDELYPAHSGLLANVVSNRAQAKREARWAAAAVPDADAAPARYVYSHKPCGYLRGRDPFPYRRHRILRETKQFFFVAADDFGEPVNAAGEPDPNSTHNSFRRGRSSSYRIKKADFEIETDYRPIGSADMGSDWNCEEVWLDISKLVERVNAWLPQYVDQGAYAEGRTWRNVLGLPADDHLDLLQVKRAYRKALLASHPDHGGSREQLEAVQQAYAEARICVEAG